MSNAKFFMNGGSLAVRLPKDCLPDEEIMKKNKYIIRKINKTIMIYSLDDAWEEFMNTPPATPDFGEAILEDRKTHYDVERMSLN